MRASVIIPVYNDARLDACLGSLAPQVRALGAGDAEIIVVDNGSRDDILETCNRFADDVVLVREPKEGSYAARNTGLHMARGAVYAFTDADCLPNPDWLRRGLLAFEDGGVQVLTGPVRFFARHPGRPNLVETYQICTGFPVQRYVDEKRFGPTANLWIRASVVQEIGAFDERLRSGGDVEWCKRALRSGYATRYCKKLIVHHPARDNLRAVALQSRRVLGGHFMLALEERRLAELVRRKFWPTWTIRSIFASRHIGRAQKGRALLVELWLYFVRLVELGRLLLGGKPLR
ncbi:MAG: glycosyltransferase [Gemmatimonadota bacterium]